MRWPDRASVPRLRSEREPSSRLPMPSKRSFAFLPPFSQRSAEAARATLPSITS